MNLVQSYLISNGSILLVVHLTKALLGDRRAVSGTVTALIAIVAVLGTAIYFLDPHSNLNNQFATLSNDPGMTSQNPQLLSSPQSEQTSTTEVEELTASETVLMEATVEATKHDGAGLTPAEIEECSRLGIASSECTENEILAAH